MNKRVKILSNTSDHIVKHNKVHRTQTRALHKFKITDYITKFIVEKFKVSLYTKHTIVIVNHQFRISGRTKPSFVKGFGS